MKTFLTMLPLLLSLFISVSCGKDDEAATSSSSSPSSTTPSVPSSDLLNMIQGDKFPKVYFNATVTYQNYITSIETETSCSFLGIFDFDCFYTSSKTKKTTSFTNYETTSSVTHHLGSSRSAVISAMVAMVNKKQTIYQSGPIYNLITTDGKTYVFDFNKPISANPTSFYDQQALTGSYIKALWY